MERYTDTKSGEELYVQRTIADPYSRKRDVFYFKDEGMTIYHRIDGPAVIWADGGVGWLANNKSHRLDGPAKTWSNGDTDWYINDVLVMELDKHNKILSKLGVDTP